MTFEEILDHAMAMLQRRGRVTYRTLRLQFQLDEEQLEALKEALIDAERLAVDEEGRVLVWTGAEVAPPSPTAFPTSSQDHTPLAYTPSYLAEKILTSRSALEGERKQVTVLFADLKGSMELLAERDPEEARQLLDPVLQRMMEAVHRYEGTVNQVMGDGIMALFGAPLAHEGRRQPIVRNGPPSSSPIRRLYPCTAVAPIETPPDKGRAAEPRPPAPWGPRRSRPHRRTGRRRCRWAAAPRDYPRIRPYRGSGRRTRCGSDVT